jgi:hypothetical protein
MLRKPALALALVAAWWSAQPLQAQQPERAATDHAAHREHFDRCAKACGDCQRACDSCATHCANRVAEGNKEHLTTLRTCRDCASFCAAAAQIVSRQGPFSDLICQSCAEACARCGKACEQFPDDAHMKACAEECRKCEKACRDMLSHVKQASK